MKKWGAAPHQGRAGRSREREDRPSEAAERTPERRERSPEGGLQISVVIPTLNEGNEIAGAVESVRRHAVGPEPEIAVIDSGSLDDTVTIARRLSVRVEVDGTLGSRAAACNRGAGKTVGEILLFLHADSRVPPAFDGIIRSALADPGVVGGAFEFALDGPEWRLRAVEGINRVRYRIRKRFFGDQGIFVRRTVFDRVSGFPSAPILEDARFCARARRQGEMRLLPAPMRTSPRRFYNGGILTTLAADVLIVLVDLAGLPVEAFAGWYRRDNLLRGHRDESAAPSPT